MDARAALLLAAGALTAAVLAGCGNDKPATIDTPRVEAKIHAWARLVKVVPKPVVECPSGVPIKVDSTFACTVSGGGRSIDLEVRIRNKDGAVTFHVD
jgi:hypothetical protein